MDVRLTRQANQLKSNDIRAQLDQVYRHNKVLLCFNSDKAFRCKLESM